MNRWARQLAAIAPIAVAAGFIVVQASWAEEKTKEVYVSTATKTTLLQKALAGADGKQITIDRYAMPGGWVGGKHYHSGPVFVYVIEGSFSVEEEGASTEVFGVGQVYEEPIGTPMLAKNVSSSAPMEVLVIQISKEGEPLMYKAD